MQSLISLLMADTLQQILPLYEGKIRMAIEISYLTLAHLQNAQKPFSGKNTYSYFSIKIYKTYCRLKLVSKESQKTENVDLQELLCATQRCLVILSRLLEAENNSIRIVRPLILSGNV